ncbi:helix-turn-helix domain-containing protein [Erythrobacter sp. GH1-10]|uniref:helix-turn-helix domain-containing protein n=1 Tax=Erythrobacter sp. GH1-10 TaxID=3349334 RepID=UPI003877DCDC
MIEQADFLVRVLAIGASLLLIAQLVAGEARPAIKIPLVGLVVGVIGYLINSSTAIPASELADPLIDLVSISTPFWIWLFARRLFESEPPRRILIGAAVALTAGWFFGNFVPSVGRLPFYFIHIVALALIADLVRVAMRDRLDDLVEQRRLIRLWLPLLVAAQAAGILIYEFAEGPRQGSPAIQLANAVLILLITLFVGMALLRTETELLLESEGDTDPEEPAHAPDLNPSEQVLYDKLTSAMEDGAYRETGLTIAALADKLDTPEHRLRALINRRLGHRNFSAFLNRYRIAEAREKLASREDVDLPVLTIAMDLGYNSLPTFNRAFRAETGTTPSEFRKQSFNGEAQDRTEQN